MPFWQLQMPSGQKPHSGHTPCSVAGSQTPSPQKQSLQVLGVSPRFGSHAPLPQPGKTQSPGQVFTSPFWHTPSPQAVGPQSGQPAGSPLEQTPSPQKPQSAVQL